MRTFFSAQSAAAAVSAPRAWSEKQLIAAVKSDRRAPFGELCERHMKQVSCVTRRITRNREDAEDAAEECFLNECFLNAFVPLKDFDGRYQFAESAGGPSASGASVAKRKDCQSHAE
jgi:hypothetical protein